MSDAQVFVIEGADGTGKTTLIATLSVEAMRTGRSVSIHHNTASDAGKPGDLYHYYRHQLEDAVVARAKGITTYIDRSFLSEVIYGNLYRGASRVTLEEAYDLEEYARSMDITLVGLVASESTREDRILRRGERWDEQQPFVGTMYQQYFQDRNQFWIIADSPSAFTSH